MKKAFPSGLEWIFGNRLELLADALAAKWRKNPGLWLERRVVVPNQAMGHWLQHHLATRLGICTGMQWWTPRSLALELHKERSLKGALVLPSKGELHLTLYSLIVSKLSAKRGPNDSLWSPLQSAFSSGREREQLDERRLAHFCSLLADIFERYSEFGARAVRKWEGTRLSQSEHWQAFLWRSLFGKGGPYTSLFSLCEQLADELSFDPPKARAQRDLDVFALRHLSNAHWRLLRKASAKMRVSIFALSPCRYYWSDVRSSREQTRFLRWIATKGATASTLEAFESALRQSHPLLANLGKVGRRFVEKSEIGNALIDECYALPHALAEDERYSQLWQHDIARVLGKKTLLGHLQADLLFMRPFDKSSQGISRIDCDGSIEVHCATSRLRELEIAKALIHQSLRADATLAPSDFLLLVPDVAEYEALATTAFAQDEFGLQLRVLESHTPQFGGFWQSLNQLLEVAESGFSADKICKALANPLIQKSIGLDAKEILLLTQKVRQSGVEWGLDAQNRIDHLMGSSKGEKAASEGGTWGEFHKTLLQGLAFCEPSIINWQALIDPTQKKPQSVEDLASTCQILDKWLRWFALAKEFLCPIAKRQKLFMIEWMVLLMQGADRLLSARLEQDGERQALFKWCSAFEKRAQDHPILEQSIDKTPLSWSFVGQLLKEQMAHVGQARSFRRQGIRLASLASGAIPARIIIAMGLSEGTLPRAQLRQPFELTAAEGMEYAPSSGDWDRCFFLEMLLAARDKLVMTYCASERDDPLEIQEPSLLVEELLLTLGHMVGNQFMRHPSSIFELSLDEKKRTCHFCHPQEGWDAKYFTAKCAFPTFDRWQFRCAVSAQLARPRPLGMRLEGMFGHRDKSALPLGPTSIKFNLRQLAKALAHPLEFFLNERCRISLWRGPVQKSRWLLDKRQRQKLQKLHLMDELKECDLIDNQTHLMAHANFERLHGEKERLAPLLPKGRAAGLDLHLTKGADQIFRLDDKTWLMPAQVSHIGGIEVQVEGHLNDNQWLGPWGLALIDLEKSVKLSAFCRHWPHIVAFCDAQPAIRTKRCVLIGDALSWEPEPFCPKLIWPELLRFALAAYRDPLPLLPDWFDSYERGDARELQERFYAEMAKRVPDHPHTLQWIFGERIDSSLFDLWIESYHALWRAEVRPALNRLVDQIAHLKKTSRPKPLFPSKAPKS